MEFVNACINDVDEIFRLYDAAVEFQKTVFDKTWQGFSRNQIETEIAEARLWKIVEDEKIACIYSVTYSDPVIWGTQSHESAMYIHRIVTNPEFRGRSYARRITEWAKEFAKMHGLRFIRMDTWSDNRKLREYYQDCGFTYLKNVEPDTSDSLPTHYRGISLSLLEIDLYADSTAI